MVKLIALAVLVASPSVAQSSGPACLQGLVTKGNVTVSCVTMDNSGVSTSAITSFVFGTLLQVIASSSDPNTVGVQITLVASVFSYSPALPGAPPAVNNITLTYSGIALKSQTKTGDFRYTFYVQQSSDQNGLPTPSNIQSVTVQELQVASSQTF